MVEIYFNVQSDNGSITDDHALRRWSKQYLRSLEDKKELRIGSTLRNLVASAGLEEVDTKMIPLPLSAWSPGKPSCHRLGAWKILTPSRSENARDRAVQQRQYPPTSAILGALPSHSAVAYVDGEFRCPSGAGSTRGKRPLLKGVFPVVSATLTIVMIDMLTR